MNRTNAENGEPLACLYLAALPDDEPACKLSHEERAREVERISDPTLRREKYYVWRLLELALARELGLSSTEAGLTRLSSGRWVARGADLELSLSHSGGALAVALSDRPIGVDIEPLYGRGDASLAERVLTERERATLPEGALRDEAFRVAWCRKEAVFKRSGESRFLPRQVDGTDASVTSGRAVLGDKEYIYAVACEPPSVRVVFVTELDAE